ncbi:hypothetical protein LX36DRAFT_36023 [Colletotrichum falcatum]|nr:hypothetical protein LX36DRAFT_36023 [Colletotrichum falcatum]
MHQASKAAHNAHCGLSERGEDLVDSTRPTRHRDWWSESGFGGWRLLGGRGHSFTFLIQNSGGTMMPVPRLLATLVIGIVRLLASCFPTGWQAVRHQMSTYIIRGTLDEFPGVLPELGAGVERHPACAAVPSVLLLRTACAAIGRGVWEHTGISQHPYPQSLPKGRTALHPASIRDEARPPSDIEDSLPQSRLVSLGRIACQRPLRAVGAVVNGPPPIRLANAWTVTGSLNSHWPCNAYFFYPLPFSIPHSHRAAPRAELWFSRWQL